MEPSEGHAECSLVPGTAVLPAVPLRMSIKSRHRQEGTNPKENSPGRKGERERETEAGEGEGEPPAG